MARPGTSSADGRGGSAAGRVRQSGRTIRLQQTRPADSLLGVRSSPARAGLLGGVVHPAVGARELAKRPDKKVYQNHPLAVVPFCEDADRLHRGHAMTAVRESDQTDRQLLEGYVLHRDEAALEALV